MEHIDKVTRMMYPSMSTHSYADEPHVKRYGSKDKDARYGTWRGSIQLQNQFMIASLMFSGTPIYMESYPENLDDSRQYRDFIQQLMYNLKPDSLVVIDHEGPIRSYWWDHRLEEYLQFLPIHKLGVSMQGSTSRHQMCKSSMSSWNKWYPAETMECSFLHRICYQLAHRISWYQWIQLMQDEDIISSLHPIVEDLNDWKRQLIKNGWLRHMKGLYC